MTTNDFIRTRQKDWERLTALLDAYQRAGRRMSPSEVRELGALYRAVSSDLAIARRDYAGERVTLYLNQLLTRAHNFIYREDSGGWGGVVQYLTQTLPQTFRAMWRFTLASFLLFIIPFVIGYLLALRNPDIAEPLGLAEERAVLASQSTWTDIPVNERPFVSAFIMTNNIRVALLAFGGGLLFGLFTAYILATNGLIIGAVLGLASHYGLGMSLLDFIIAHGVIELSVIFISGGAGLAMGWALFNPGAYTRRDALMTAARKAVQVVVIGIPLLVVAGIIEGFISPSSLPFAVKAAVGVGTGVVLYAYLLRVGRERGAVAASSAMSASSSA